ncbi:NAD(P)H-dependent oxidoreductase [Eubacterium ramulus]|uniref:NADPH-dependent FMN reductase n=1 Tax=Eubacterium ramulus TaxID=39490 RepID=A0A173VA83_EUBRA|nr:NAD(P)H-dependent oxidoreductase [Eubacterium ramulus]CUN23187.1 NADPH-dependent FMN reductase [Eubacterium ramulus]
MKTLLLSAGRKNGNNEILGKQALMQIQKKCGSEIQIIRLQDLHIEQCIGCESCMRSLVSGGDGKCIMKDKDDMAWLLEQVKDVDAIILSAPIYDLIPSGNMITLLNRVLGVGLEYRNMCKQQKKVGAVIAVGGSDWIDLTEPLITLSLINLCKGSIVVDRLIVGGNTAPSMVLLDDELMERAALLGDRVADALTDKKERFYKGEKGVCPSCHCNLLIPTGKNNVSCAFCAAKGKILSVSEELKIEWDQESIDHNRFTEAGEMQHQEDIRTANKKAFCVDGKQLIADKKKIYMEYKPYIQPER